MSNFQFLNLVFSDQNGTVTNVTNSVASNALTPAIYGPIGCSSFVFKGIVDVNTPGAGTFTANATTDLLTQADHGFYTGLILQVSNSGGALPTGLSALTDYYVIRVSSSTYRLATSLANALNNTYINITGAGSGTNTATPTALASASIYLQGSNDNQATWVTIPNTTTSISADGNIGPIEVDYVRYETIRAYAALASGMMAFTELQIGYRGA